MSRASDPAPAARRERRAAARQSAAVAAHRPAGHRTWFGRAFLERSPIAALTGGVLAVAIIGIVAVQLLQGSGAAAPAAPGTRTASGILVPLSGTPSALTAGRSVGRADAPLTLTVWSDFQCSACRTFAMNVEPSLITDYVTPGKLRIDYRDLLIIGPESMTASVASRCADNQGRFWPYHDVLFANQLAENSGGLTSARLADMAVAVGLDRPTFDACVADTTVLTAIKKETAQGLTRGQSTPTLDFGTEVIAGSPPYAQLTAKIDALLAAKASK